MAKQKINLKKIYEDNEDKLKELKDFIKELTTILTAWIIITAITILLILIGIFFFGISSYTQIDIFIVLFIELIIIIIFSIKILYLEDKAWNIELNLDDFFNRI